MKVLLINPIERDFLPPSIFPLGLGYISAVLSKAGHSVKVLDLNGRRESKEVITEELNHEDYDIVGVTSIIAQYRQVKEIVRGIRRFSSTIPIILGGTGPTSAPEVYFKNMDIDFIAIGESEDTIVELMELYEKKEPLDSCKGIAYRQDNKVVFTKGRPFIEDLDSIPMPEWGLFDTIKTYTDNFLFKIDHRKGINILGSRGCPARCNFCLNNFGRRVRFRSPESIIKEMRVLNARYGIEHFHFIDDTIVVIKKVIFNFCEKLEESGLSVTWSANARANLVSKELLERMARCGCKFLAYGIESGSPKILKEIKKGISVSSAANAIRWTSEVGINCRAYFIIGMPGETEETIQETVDFCKTNLVGGEFFFATPFPKTELYDYAISKGLIKDEDGYLEAVGEVRDFVINLTQFSNEELFDLKEQAEQEIQDYLRAKGVEVRVGIRKDPRETVKTLPAF